MRTIAVPAPMTVYPTASRAVSFSAAGEYPVEDDVADAAIAKGATEVAASDAQAAKPKPKRARKPTAAKKAPAPAPAPLVAIVEPVTDPEPAE